MDHRNILNSLSKLFSRAGSSAGAADDATVESLREEVERLRKSVETLSILNDLAVAMGAAASPEEAVEELVDRSMRVVDAEQAVVTLLGQRKTDPMKTEVRLVRSSAANKSYHVDESLVGWMLCNRRPLMIGDPRNDPRFPGLRWDDSIRNVMCIPMIVKSELIGVLTIYNKKGASGFYGDDERLMSIIGAQSGQIIENARLARDKGRMEDQLNLASEIQRNLLPKYPPVLDGYDIAGKTVPAQSVGGDYYDFIPIDDDRLAVCLGDVSGKAMPAALLMANLQATLRGQTLVETPVNERIERANKLLCQCTDDERFATLFYAVLDGPGNELVLCNAGHERPYLFSPGGAYSRLESGGLALGVFEDVRYDQESIVMNTGDLLLVYSDGVVDAVNPANERFGGQRLVSLVGEHRDESAGALIDRIFTAVEAHAGGASQFDDLTLLVIKRTN